MPFDGLSLNPLADVARSLGITPVPLDVLEAHKKAEVAKHPVSWFYKHPTIATFGPAVLTGFLFSSAMLLFLSIAASSLRVTLLPLIPLSIGMLCTAGIVLYRCIMTFSGLNGPAYWIEKYGLSDDVPTEIAHMARQIRRVLPGSYPMVGELRQDQVVLDPYLVMCLDDQRIVLGIWDDKGIIQQAEH